MMIDQNLIDRIIAEVLARLKNGLPETEKRNVVILFTGARKGSDAGLEAINRLSRSQHCVSVMQSAASKNILPESKLREAGARTIIETGPQTDIAHLVKKMDLLLVPTLTTRMAGILALGLMESPAATLILRALLAGKPVIAVKDASDPEGYVAEHIYGGKPGASPALRAVLNGYLKTLESFGMELVCEEYFLKTMELRLAALQPVLGALSEKTGVLPVSLPTVPAFQVRRLSGFVTERDLLDFEPDMLVQCAADTRFTPQAKDTLQRMRLRLEFI